MRTRMPLLTVGVAAVALSGCTTSAPPTDFDVYIPEIHGTTPDSAADEWRIDFDHVGPVAIGFSFTELAQQHPGLVTEDYGGYCGSGYWPDEEDPLGSMSVLAESQGMSGPVDTVYVGVPEPRTAEGIGIGSTRADVLAAYPDLRESPHTYVENGSYLDVENGSGLAMRFLTDERSVVDLIVVGRIPQVYYVEGCL